jgi:glutathione S-transferase
VGDRFSVADLACAALLAPLVSPDHPDVRQPEPLPDALAAFLARFASHSGAAWVREQYARHRPAPCAVVAQSDTPSASRKDATASPASR